MRGVEAVLVDLYADAVDEHDGVVDDDAGQGDDAQQGHESEGLAGYEQPGNHADEAQRDGQHDDERLANGVELPDEQDQNQEARYGQFGAYGGVGVGRTLERAADFVAIAERPALLLLRQPGFDGCDDAERRGVRSGVEVRQDRQRFRSVAAKHFGWLEGEYDVRNLPQRHVQARLRVDVDGFQLADIVASADFGAQHHGNGLVALPVLRDCVTRERRAQRNSNVLVGNARPPRPGIVDVHNQFLGLFAPVVRDVARTRDRGETGLYVVGQIEQDILVGSIEPDLYRRAAARTRREPFQRYVHVRVMGFHVFAQAGEQARYGVVRRCIADQRGVSGAGLRRAVAKVEPGRAGAYEESPVADAVPLLFLRDGQFLRHEPFDIEYGRFRIVERRAVREFEVAGKEHFPRFREKALLHEAKQSEGRGQQGERAEGRNQGALQEGPKRAAVAPVKRGVERGVFVRGRRRFVFAALAFGRLGLFDLQEKHAQERDHRNRQQPGGKQRQGDDLGQGGREFPDRAFGQHDGQERGDGGEGRNEQGNAQFACRSKGGVPPAFALLDAHQNRFAHHDGVIDQQSQRNDERNQRHLVQPNAEELHQHERGQHRHGNQRGDHQAGAEPQEQQHAQQHDAYGLHNRVDERRNGPVHDLGLEGDDIEGDAHGIAFFQFRHGGPDVLPQQNNIAARAHRNRQRQRGLRVGPYLRLRRIHVSSMDVGDISKVDRLSRPWQRDQRPANIFHGSKVAGGLQRDALRAGLYGPSRNNDIAGLQDALKLRHRKSQPGKARIVEIHKDALVLDAVDLDLGHIVYLEEDIPHLFGDLFEFRVGESVRRERQHGSKDVAHLVVHDGRDALGQCAGRLVHLPPQVVPHRTQIRNVFPNLDRNNG